MSTLYLDRRSTVLSLSNRRLRIEIAEAPVKFIPIKMLERIVLFGDIQFTTSTIATLADAGVSLTLLSGRHGALKANILGAAHNDATIRLQQYRIATDSEQALILAKSTIGLKLHAQIAMMQHLADTRHGGHLKQTRALRELHLLRDAGFEHMLDRPQLLGLEGAAARSWFAGYIDMFPTALGFTQRNRRPPTDPVNACLSLGYTMLYSEALNIAYALGLDPLIGYYHQPEHGRASLACDLIEPLRPHLDYWAWSLFHASELRAEHFSTEKGGRACLLGKAGRAIFYAAYEAWVKPYRRLLRMGVAHHVRELRG